MTSGNDLASEGGFSQDIYTSVVVEKSVFLGYSSVMGEGCSDSCIPEFSLSGRFFDLSVYEVGRGHHECSEMFCLEDDDVVIIFLALVVVIAA